MDLEDSTLGKNSRRIADLPLLKILLAIRQNSRGPSFLGKERLFCFINISFENPFATITSLPELHFRSKRFIMLIQTKEVVSMSYGSSASRWKPWRWMRLGLIFAVKDIYINSNLNSSLTFSSSGRNKEFKGTIHKRIVISHPFEGWKECEWKPRQQHDQNFPLEG